METDAAPRGRTAGRTVDRRGIAIEAAASAAAVALVVYAATKAGLGAGTLVAVLLAASPLIGEFAVTMAARYRPQMTAREAAARMLWPSSCDSCGIVLSQWDILPVVPYVVRRGRCGCRSFAVPATCTAVGLATLAASSAIVAAAWALRGDAAWALAPLVCALAFCPAIVADVVHGECDEFFTMAPAAATLAVGWHHPGPAVLAGAAFAAFVGASGVLAALVRRSATPFPVGVADLSVAFGAGAILGPPGLVAATVWFLFALAASFGVVYAVAGREGSGRYGPALADGSPEGGPFAAPMVPAIVVAAVVAYFWHPF